LITNLQFKTNEEVSPRTMLLRPLQRLVEAPFKKALRFALKQSLGRFLRCDVRCEQLELDLARGFAELRELELDIEELVQALGLENAPVQICSVHIGVVRVEAFGGQSEGLNMLVSDVTVVIKSAELGKGQCDKENQKHASDVQHSGADCEGGDKHTANLSSTAAEGLDTLGRWIEDYAARLKIEVLNSTVRFLVSENLDEPYLQLRLPRTTFRDEGSSEALKVFESETSFLELVVSDRKHICLAEVEGVSTTKILPAKASIEMYVPFVNVNLSPDVYPVLMALVTTLSEQANGETEANDLIASRSSEDEFFDALDVVTDEEETDDVPGLFRADLFFGGFQASVFYSSNENKTSLSLDMEVNSWFDSKKSANALGSDISMSLKRCFDAMNSPIDLGERLLIRAAGIGLDLEMGQEQHAAFTVKDLHVAELLNRNPKTSMVSGFYHSVLEMDTTNAKACTIDLVRRASMVVELAPLLMSWDNMMIQRMESYLPEMFEKQEDQEDIPIEKELKIDFQTSLVTPRALVVLRVTDEASQEWDSKALVVDMMNMEAKTGKLATAQGDSSVFREIEQLRDVIWSLTLECEAARAKVREVGVEIRWDSLLKEEFWAVHMDSNVSNRPRLQVSVREPLFGIEDVERTSFRALEIVRNARPPFKQRVHQRRAPDGELDFADPAGDHDLEKDLEAPINEVIEDVVAHGSSTASATVLLTSPFANMCLDRSQFHSVKHVLQLIVSTLPSFKKGGPPASPRRRSEMDLVLEEQQQQGGLKGFGFDSYLEETDKLQLNRSKPANTFVQMESRGGKIQLMNDLTGNFDLAYVGLQVSGLDAKTTLSALDFTLAEGVESSERIVLHGADWSRTETSPPLVQLYSEVAETSLVRLCVDGLTLRLEPQSTWMSGLIGFFSNFEREPDGTEKAESTFPVNYTEVTIEFFDSVVEYQRKQQKDGAALFSLGLLRLSSNVATPAVKDQSFHITARDLAAFVSEDSLPRENLETFSSAKLLQAFGCSQYSSLEDFTSALLFTKIGSADFLELFIRRRLDAADGIATMDYEFSVPNVDLYTCKDSMQTLEGLVHDMLETFSKDPDSIDDATMNEMVHSMEMDNAIIQEEEDAKAGSVASETEDVARPKSNADDQLSGAELRKRHKTQGTIDSGGFVEGFYAVESVAVIEAEQATAAEDDVVDIQAPKAGLWYNIEQDDEYLVWDRENEQEALDLEEFEMEEFPPAEADAELLDDERRASLEMKRATAEYRERLMHEVRADVPEREDIFARENDESREADDKEEGRDGRWFQSSELKIYPHYMGVPYEAGPGSHIPTTEALAARLEETKTLSARIGKGETQVVLRDMNVRWTLFGGCDWNSTAMRLERENAPREAWKGTSNRFVAQTVSGSGKVRKSRHPLCGRKNDTKIEVNLLHVSALASSFAWGDEPYICKSIAVAVRDFMVVDKLASSDINLMICEWFSDTEHPRISGSSMLKLAIDQIKRPERDSLAVRASAIPLKANFDQDSLEFLQQFLSLDARSPQQQEAAKHDNDEEREWDKDEVEDDEFADIIIVENTDWLIETVDIRAFRLRIDYRPKRFNFQSLMNGDRMSIINLFAYEGLEVVMRRFEMEDVRGGWRALFMMIEEQWNKDVRRQRHKCLAGVSFPPINKVATIGKGFSNLVMMPLEQYNKDGRIVHGIRRGTSSFARTVAIEALGTFSKAAMTAQSLLEHARDVFSTLPAGTEFGVESVDQSQLASSIAGSSQPRDVHEGLQSAADSFTKEFKRAAFVLVALPIDDFQRDGATGAVKSVLRGVPIAVIRPLIGATQAVSSTLLGLRNSVDPDKHKEENQKFKNRF